MSKMQKRFLTNLFTNIAIVLGVVAFCALTIIYEGTVFIYSIYAAIMIAISGFLAYLIFSRAIYLWKVMGVLEPDEYNAFKDTMFWMTRFGFNNYVNWIRDGDTLSKEYILDVYGKIKDIKRPRRYN